METNLPFKSGKANYIESRMMLEGRLTLAYGGEGVSSVCQPFEKMGLIFVCSRQSISVRDHNRLQSQLISTKLKLYKVFIIVEWQHLAYFCYKLCGVI